MNWDSQFELPTWLWVEDSPKLSGQQPLVNSMGLVVTLTVARVPGDFPHWRVTYSHFDTPVGVFNDIERSELAYTLVHSHRNLRTALTRLKDEIPPQFREKVEKTWRMMGV